MTQLPNNSTTYHRHTRISRTEYVFSYTVVGLLFVIGATLVSAGILLCLAGPIDALVGFLTLLGGLYIAVVLTRSTLCELDNPKHF